MWLAKTTLVCAAVYNANTHSEWLIIINLYQSVQKKLLQYKSRQTTIKKFNKQFFLLRMRLVYLWRDKISNTLWLANNHAGKFRPIIATAIQMLANCNKMSTIFFLLRMRLPSWIKKRFPAYSAWFPKHDISWCFLHACF